jgi:hypothetical protein
MKFLHGWLAILLLAGGQEMAADTAALSGLVVDAASGLPVPCEVCITDAQGRTVLESESFTAGFRCRGRFEKLLPPGPTRVRITRGPEIRAVERELVLRAGQKAELKVKLERVVDLRSQGWYAGENHAHMLHGEKAIPVNFDELALAGAAADLQYLAAAQTWELKDPSPEALEAQFKPRSTAECQATWNLEAPKNYYLGDAGRCLGHGWTVALRGRTSDGRDAIRTLLDTSAWDYESSKPPFANFEMHEFIHENGGRAFYTHPARWWMGAWGGQGGYARREQMRISNLAVELPLDTLAGPTYDGLDVLTGAGENGANEIAFQTWALLLNHGYRLAATGSSDACFDRRGGAVPGAVRTYTYAPGGFTLAAVAQAMAEGKNVVTTGPLLLATLDGAPPGSALPANGRPHELRIVAWASGSQPGGLRRLEILRNGEPWQQFNIPGRSPAWKMSLAVQENQNSWFCVRVFGEDEARQRAISGAFFLDEKPHRPPPPVPAVVAARILDAKSGQLLPGGRLTEVRFSANQPRLGKAYELKSGRGTVTIPATVRLRAEAPGHEAVTLSPFFDFPRLVEMVTRLEDRDLANWDTYERIRSLLGSVELEFRLPPASDRK